MAPTWKLRHAKQMVDGHGIRTLLMDRMTMWFTFMVHLTQLVDDRASVNVFSLVVLSVFNVK